MPISRVSRLDSPPSASRPPWVVWGLVLISISITEFGVMVTLPRFLPADTSRAWESLLDALLLTSIVSPLMWWSTVRPLQESARLREQFVSSLIAATERERHRIAHELHDGLGQSLTLLVSGLRSLSVTLNKDESSSRVDDLARIAKQILVDAKQMALGLRPSLLDDLGLVAAIQSMADDFAKHQNLKISLVTSLEGSRFSTDVETALFRICQEAIQNVSRHSKASEATISLSLQGNQLRLEVRDNGEGFDIRNRPPTSGHMGLIGMRERVVLLGGQFRIESSSGHGTRVIAEVPARQEEKRRDARHVD